MPAEPEEEEGKLRAVLEEAAQEADELRGSPDQVVQLQQALENASSDFNRVNAVSAAVCGDVYTVCTMCDVRCCVWGCVLCCVCCGSLVLWCCVM